MSKIASLWMLLLLAVGAAAQPQDGLTLRCMTPSTRPGHEDELVRAMSQEEKERIHIAPHGARRVGKHQLEVTWAGGNRVFTDKPPFDEPLDGIGWVYCGYDAKPGVHLILKRDQSVFTGALLDDRTGSLLPGGQRVLFSPDQKYYLAYEQPDGQDGETIKLYKRNGMLVWKGFNGILSSDGITVVADFERMRWDKQDRLQAAARLDGGKTVTVTLTQNSNGKREWLPDIRK